MAYCTSADVNVLIPQAPFSGSSRPSISEVTSLCDQISARIDATVANVGYVVPITGTKALPLVTEACAWGVLGLAQTIRGTGANQAVTDKGQPIENIWTQKFNQWLKALCDLDNPFELPDAPRNGEKLEKQPENVLRSFVQAVSDQTPFLTTAQVGRSQVL
jgi:hypothetical protein